MQWSSQRVVCAGLLLSAWWVLGAMPGGYTALAEAKTTKSKAIEEDRKHLDAAASVYAKSCKEYLKHQNEMMHAELTVSPAHRHINDTAKAPSHGAVATTLPVEPAACPAGDAVLEQLRAGNQRYAAGTMTHAHLDKARREETSKGQHPQATVLACSDSRVPVEELFDQGIGDLFPIRVAGNVCGTDELGTVEYGVDHLETPLLIVLGHTKCGAVTAACTNATVHGRIPALLNNIKPAVEKTRKCHRELSGDALICACAVENVWHSIEVLLTHSQSIQDRTKAGKVKVVGAMYNIEDGTIEWIGKHPEQIRLLAVAVPDEHDGHDDTSTQADARAATRLELLEKITLINEIMELGNETRVAFYKSQALGDPALIQEAGKNFAVIAQKLEALRKITQQREDLNHLNETQVATGEYKKAMNDLLRHWSALQGDKPPKNKDWRKGELY